MRLSERDQDGWTLVRSRNRRRREQRSGTRRDPSRPPRTDWSGARRWRAQPPWPVQRNPQRPPRSYADVVRGEYGEDTRRWIGEDRRRWDSRDRQPGTRRVPSRPPRADRSETRRGRERPPWLDHHDRPPRRYAETVGDGRYDSRRWTGGDSQRWNDGYRWEADHYPAQRAAPPRYPASRPGWESAPRNRWRPDGDGGARHRKYRPRQRSFQPPLPRRQGPPPPRRPAQPAPRVHQVESEDPDFNLKVRVLHEIIRSAHHLKNVAADRVPPTIRRMTDTLASFIKPAYPSEATSELIVGNAKNWEHTTLILLQDHFAAVMEGGINRLSAFRDPEWRAPYQVASSWARRNLGRRLQEETLVQTQAIIVSHLEDTPSSSPGASTQRSGAAPQSPTASISHRTTGTPPATPPPRVTGTVSGEVDPPPPPPPPPETDWFLPAIAGEQREPQPQRSRVTDREVPPANTIQSAAGTPAAGSPSPLLSLSPSSSSSSPLSVQVLTRARSPGPPTPRVQPLNPCVVVREEGISTLSPEGERVGTPTAASSRKTPQPQPRARLAPLFTPADGGRPTTPTPPATSPQEAQFVPESQPLPSPTDTGRVTRHINTTRKVRDWALTVRARKIIIGDSNLSRFPPFQQQDLQIDSFPGAHFGHATALLNRVTVEVVPDTVVLAFGVNHRSQRNPETAVKQLQAAVRAAKVRFPRALIQVPALNFSDALPIGEKMVLKALNKYIKQQGFYIDALPRARFQTGQDKVHWSHNTAVAMLQHWLNYLN